MEENITHRKTGDIAILICNKNNADTQEDNYGEEKPRHTGLNFFFKKADATFIQNHDITGYDLILLAGYENDEAEKITDSLKKKNIPSIIPGTLTDSEIRKITGEIDKAFSLGFDIKDFVQIYNLGIAVNKIAGQLDIFKNGLPKVTLKKPATINDGIFPLPEHSAEKYAAYFESRKDSYGLMKFVPASGAATRMFKFLLEFINEYDPETETINAYINRKTDNALNVFLAGKDKFPFYRDIVEVIKQNPDYNNKNTRNYNFIKTMLLDEQFDYANKPKGVLPFHQYENFTATPVYEHLYESTAYAESNGKTHVHFTISEDHLDGFLDCINDVKEGIEKATGAALNFSFSYQHKSTDTIAVTPDNKPFRDDDGNLFFRPGGHGALIENLNGLDADIVFIKNIDNVSHNNTHTISLYKKALGGMLMQLQEKIFSFLELIEKGRVNQEDIAEILDFAQSKLSIAVAADVEKYTPENQLEYLKELLNRPIRICGMVKNEGEPGGGPFWVKNEDGKLSLQIVETSQVDKESKSQKNILSQATHFNPVDLVCGLKDYKGNAFDLTQYVDASTGFIVQKNRMGHDVKSYELPGLWNGAMAGWITLFVEVPLDTFSPVKTVNDLLKPAHQPQ